MPITKPVNQYKVAGTPLKMIAEPVLLELVATGLKKDERPLREGYVALHAMVELMDGPRHRVQTDP